jgi:flagellar motor switch protein FliG
MTDFTKTKQEVVRMLCTDIQNTTSKILASDMPDHQEALLNLVQNIAESAECFLKES